MPFPKPIRYDRNEWLCMRNDPVLPKAIIRRVTVTDQGNGQQLEKFRVVSWAIDRAERKRLGYYDDLAGANDSVLYDIVVHGPAGPPNGTIQRM